MTHTCRCGPKHTCWAQHGRFGASFLLRWRFVRICWCTFHLWREVEQTHSLLKDLSVCGNAHECRCPRTIHAGLDTEMDGAERLQHPPEVLFNIHASVKYYGSKVRPNHFQRPLVADCSIEYDPAPYFRWQADQTETSCSKWLLSC